MNSEVLAAVTRVLPWVGVAGMFFALITYFDIKRRPPGNELMQKIAGKIHHGAFVFIKSEYQKGYGNVVILDHGKGITTLYAHNRENLVKEGEWIRKGAPVAEVGSTGRSTGPHLHFEVRRHGKHLDPLEFLGQGPVFTKG